jgi:SsrA-binding protein
MKRKDNTLIVNKKVEQHYKILDKFKAGVVLRGFEVKSLKNYQGSFADSFVTINNQEAYLKNFYLPAYQKKNTPNGYDEYRDRKLLLNKKEILRLEKENKKAGITMVPLVFELSEKGQIKLEFALASGLTKFDKREKMKERDDKRKMDIVIKTVNRSSDVFYL